MIDNAGPLNGGNTPIRTFANSLILMPSKLSKKHNSLVHLLRSFILIFLTFFCTSYTAPVPKNGSVKNPYAITCVVIDAGHGGHDSGCLGSKTKEKDVALAISLKLGKYIEDNFKDVKVIYTRSTDKFVELHERAAIANNAKANLFICIHCNSACVYDKKKRKDVCNEDIKGTEVWVMGLKKADENLQVAKRENDVVLLEEDYQKKYDGFDPNSPEANIIFSLYQNVYLEQSLRIASYVESEVQKDSKRDGRGVKQAGFLVLYKTTMPSLLIETGFLTNKEEEAFLGSPAGQDKMAHSIFRAFKNYKLSVEPAHKDLKTNVEEPVVEVKDTQKIKPDTVRFSDVKTENKTPAITKVVPPPRETPKPKEPRGNLNTAEEIYFSVQFVTSPAPLKKGSSKLKGQTVYREEKVDGMYKYLQGHLSTFEEAVKLQGSLRENGFPDAFAVAYKGATRIPVKEARQLVKKN